MTLYMRVTSDKYELPLAVADSKRELAEIQGLSVSAVKSAYSLKTKTYVKVEVEDENEREIH